MAGNTGIPTEFSIAIGKRLKALRNDRDWTMEYVGTMIGKSKGLVGQYEKGKAVPSVSVLLELADLFGVTTDYILVGKLSDISGDIDPQVLETAISLQRLKPEDRATFAKIFGPAVSDSEVEKSIPATKKNAKIWRGPRQQRPKKANPGQIENT